MLLTRFSCWSCSKLRAKPSKKKPICRVLPHASWRLIESGRRLRAPIAWARCRESQVVMAFPWELFEQLFGERAGGTAIPGSAHLVVGQKMHMERVVLALPRRIGQLQFVALL